MSLLDLFQPVRPAIRGARRERLGKSAKAKYDRERYLAKREQLLAQNKAWYEANREAALKRMSAYYAENRERCIANAAMHVRAKRRKAKATP